jgi:two-component system cell cycle sensor histidine kinase/response regulator CckA
METKITTVLLVDDIEDRLLVYSIILKKSGYDVIKALNGADCLRLAQERNPDIILLDVVLPDINGLEVCRQLKANPETQHILILLVSSIEIQSHYQSRGLDSGADGYVTLPVTNQELISRVRALERIKRSEDELRASHLLLQHHTDALEKINRKLQNEINEHNRTEAALRASEQYARSIIHCSLDMIITVDNERKIVEFNESAQKTFGYTREEVVGKNIGVLYADTEEGKRVHYTTLDSGNVRSEIFNRKKNGEIFTSFLAASVLHNDKKELLGLVGVSRDITEQKRAEDALLESEERYRLLFTQAPLGIAHIDHDGVILNANKIVMEIFGTTWNPESTVTIHDQINHPQMTQIIVDSLNGVPGFYEGEYTSPSTGKEFTIRLITRPVITKGKTIDSVIAIVEDLTQQTIIRQQLIQSQKLESLGTLAGGIAHDFNNLLAMILGNAELLKKNLKNDPKSKKYVESIIDVAHRGGSISKQMLLFSYNSELKLQPISLSLIIEELKTLLQHFIPKTITVQASSEGENDFINCDMGHIHQVIINLCINARDAMGDHGTLTIRERSVHSSALNEKYPNIPVGNYVSLSVSDTGPGIDEDILQKIFDPFFTTKEKGKGTGLGLSIVDGIVRSHNGFIDVTSKKEVGTTFTLYFPSATHVVTEQSPQREFGSLNGKTILLADDELVLRQIFTEFLEELGCTVLPAADGFAAVELFRAYRTTIDLVISDLGMPTMNGEEMFEELKKIDPHVKVIISSGYLDRSIRSQLLKNGIMEIIDKPYKFDEIGDVLERVISSHH